MGNSSSSVSCGKEASAIIPARFAATKHLGTVPGGGTDLQRYPIVYHPKYNIRFWGLEKLHSFDSCKYEKIVKRLLELRVLTDEGQLVRPDAADQELLLRIHTPEYLRSLRNSGTIMRILEVPMISMLPASTIDKHVLLPMRYATGGSLQAALLAYRHGWGINLAGGYHHCSAAQGGGFCAYADISLCILGLKDCHPGIRRIMIYDGDAHQGNGFGADKRNGVYERAGVEVFILDMYNHQIYPRDEFARAAIDCDVRLESFTGDGEYLGLLRKHFTESVDVFRPDMVIFNAGTDCLEGDPLGALSLSPEGIQERDLFVFRTCRERGIPVLMLLSGGYQKNNAAVIADSIANMDAEIQLLQSFQAAGEKGDDSDDSEAEEAKIDVGEDGEDSQLSPGEERMVSDL